MPSRPQRPPCTLPFIALLAAACSSENASQQRHQDEPPPPKGNPCAGIASYISYTEQDGEACGSGTERAPVDLAPDCAIRPHLRQNYCTCDLDPGACRGSCYEFEDGSCTCECPPWRVGENCELCAEGYVMDGAYCVTPCAAAGIACPTACAPGHACSRGCDFEAVACTCTQAFSGPACDECAPGFVPGPTFIADLGAVLTCDPDCSGCTAADRVCDTTTTPASCPCAPAYVDTNDTCTWRGAPAIALPSASESCGGWSFYSSFAPRVPSAMRDCLATELGEPASSEWGTAVTMGEIMRLSVTGNCRLLNAVTVVDFPTEATFESPAVRLTVRSDGWDYFHLSFGDPGESPIQSSLFGSFFGSGLLRATDMEQPFDICIPEEVQGQHTGLHLWMYRDCPGLPDLDIVREHSLEVRGIELVSSPSCSGRDGDP